MDICYRNVYGMFRDWHRIPSHIFFGFIFWIDDYDRWGCLHGYDKELVFRYMRFDLHSTSQPHHKKLCESVPSDSVIIR